MQKCYIMQQPENSWVHQVLHTYQSGFMDLQWPRQGARNLMKAFLPLNAENNEHRDAKSECRHSTMQVIIMQEENAGNGHDS